MSDHCPITPEKLSALVDGELPASQQRELAQHIVACDSCCQQIGQLYALKVCVGCYDEEPAKVPAGLWKRVRRRLDEIDSVAGKVVTLGPRPVPAWRLGAMVTAGVLLVALALGFRQMATPSAMSWADLAPAHQTMTAQILPGTADLGRFGGAQNAATEVAWQQPRHSRTIRTQWCDGRQAVYASRGAVVSYFVMPCDSLDVSTLTQVRDADQLFYLDATPQLSMVAWRKGTGWGIVLSSLYIEQLFALAKLYAGSAQSGPGL